MIKANRNKKLKIQAEAIIRKFKGEYGYYAIRGNYKFLKMLYYKARLFWYKMLNHRGGRKKSYTKEAFDDLIRIFAFEKPRILHNI